MRIASLFLLLFLSSLAITQGQQSKIDSLKNVLSYSNDNSTKVKLLSEIGMRYHMGQVYLDSAFFYVEKALSIAKESNIKSEVARNLFNLGSIESAAKKYNESLSYFAEAIPILTSLEMKGALSSAYNNIGGNYYELGEYEMAEINYQKTLNLAIELNDLTGQGIGYMNLGEVNFIRKKFEEANASFEKSLNVLQEVGFNPPTVHLFYARSLLATNDINKALEQASLAYEISEKENDLKYIAESSNLLSNIYSSKSKFEEAYTFKKKYAIYNDSLNEAREINEIEKLKLNFELNKKKEELEHLSQKNKYQNIIYFLVALGILLLIVLISRQVKITKMTSNIHEIQRRLVEPELIEREQRERNRHATGFDATKEQDKELL